MLTGLLVFLIAVTAVLAVPVTVLFRLSWPNVRDNDVRLLWAFGLVRTRLSAELSGPESSQHEDDSESKKRPSRDKGNVWAAIRQARFRQRLWRFAGDLWDAIHKHEIRLRMRIGLGDPADTGRLWAAIGPVSGLLAGVRAVEIAVEPEFQDQTLELAGSGQIRIVPLQLLYLAAGVCLSPSIWRGLRAMRASTG